MNLAANLDRKANFVRTIPPPISNGRLIFKHLFETTSRQKEKASVAKQGKSDALVRSSGCRRAAESVRAEGLGARGPPSSSNDRLREGALRMRPRAESVSAGGRAHLPPTWRSRRRAGPRRARRDGGAGEDWQPARGCERNRCIARTATARRRPPAGPWPCSAGTDEPTRSRRQRQAPSPGP